MLFSVLTPVYDPPVRYLQEAIDSVRAQTCSDWELILVDDGSGPEVLAVLREAAAADRRIVVIERPTNGGIVASSQDALLAAKGTFVALLDHDDLLVPDALQRMREAIERTPHVDYLYSDEDKVTEDRALHYDTFWKPVWSPERLRAQMYCGHLSVIRRSVARAVGGFRHGYEGSQDHDLVLRVTERARVVVHVPEILYHWRVSPLSTASNQSAKPYAWHAGLRAVTDHVARLGIDAEVVLGPHPGYYRVQRRLDPRIRVSIVIPTRGGAGPVWGTVRVFAVEAVRTALAHTDHANLEIVVVVDDDTPAEVLDELREVAGHLLRLVPYTPPFNFSEKCNVGVLASTGDVVVLLNDDVQVRSDHWLEKLVGPLGEPDVGATGAKLFFEDGSIQHVGHQYVGRGAMHSQIREPGESLGAFGAAIADHEVSGVTAACLAMRREVFDEVGGLSEAFPVNFNDVDLCLKITGAGYRIVFMAQVELYHFESRTREARVDAWEHIALLDRWGTRDDDPYLPETRSVYAVPATPAVVVPPPDPTPSSSPSPLAAPAAVLMAPAPTTSPEDV